MLKARKHAIGLLGLALAVVSLIAGIETYRTGAKRDEQLHAYQRRMERGEIELAEQYVRPVKVLTNYSDLTRTNAYSFAGLATLAGALYAIRAHRSILLIVLTVLVAAAAVAFAYGSLPK